MLLCDLRLGPGLSGVEAIQAIRERIPGMPAMILSGSDLSALEQAQIALPDVPVMQKPVSLEVLLRTIARLANSHLPITEEIDALWFAHPMELS